MKRISNDFRLPNIEPSPCSFSAQGSLGSNVSRDITQDIRKNGYGLDWFRLNVKVILKKHTKNN